jgi:hypothetical protein
MAIEEAFLAKDVGRVTGLPLRTIIHWAENGVVGADLAKGVKTGSQRRYSRHQVFLFAVGKTLAGFGFRVPQLRAVLGIINGFYDETAKILVAGRYRVTPKALEELHIVDARYVYLSNTDGDVATRLVEMDIHGTVRMPDFSVAEAQLRADAELVVYLDRRAALLKRI